MMDDMSMPYPIKNPGFYPGVPAVETPNQRTSPRLILTG